LWKVRQLNIIVCRWQSISPGIRVRPLQSMTSAPGGMTTSRALPMALKRRPSIFTTASSITLPPTTSIRRAPLT